MRKRSSFWDRTGGSQGSSSFAGNQVRSSPFIVKFFMYSGDEQFMCSIFVSVVNRSLFSSTSYQSRKRVELQPQLQILSLKIALDKVFDRILVLESKLSRLGGSWN